MPRGLGKILSRIPALAAERQVRFTLKALRELAALGLDATDACEVLEGRRAPDFVERLASDATGEWMYVFKPHVGTVSAYLKLVLRAACVVVSFHEDEAGDDEESR